ncbi:MAG: dockerin type I repeat-containing protein, partial [candidate division Zixibacteria bacterium]|nr:dockerin type I repeat-containing protein [candidate division Zixibacteria bacterium]
KYPFRDFGTGGTGTPEGDANKYYILSFKEWDFDVAYLSTIGDSNEIWAPRNTPLAGFGSFDIRYLMSIGPFNLQPDSSVRILFATFKGDSVHYLPENFQDNLPHDPDLYLTNLNFDDVLANSAISDSLGQLLLDPNLPPLGFQIVNKNRQQPELQWDPWVYNEVTGYEIFIEEADLSQLPQPGAIPPWWAPAADEIPITLGRTYRYSIDNLNKDKFFLAAIANRTLTGTGQLSSPIKFRLNPRPGAVQLPSQYVFAKPGQPLKLKWALKENSAVDHINIYKFSDSSDAKRVYHAFYDEGYRSQFIQPKDSFFVDEKTYYYYAMVPFAVAAAEDTMFIDENFLDGNAYVIAAADEFGFESEYTRPIVAYNVTEQNREILLLTNSFVLTPHEYTYFDSISNFYSSILQGFDYEIFSFSDSFAPASCPRQDLSCLDWQDLMPYKMVIIDDRLSERIFSLSFASSNTLDALIKFQANGGKIVYFGRFLSFFGSGTHIINGVPQYLTASTTTSQLFGISGMFAGSERYYYNNASPPYVDSLFGFIRAQHKEIDLPSLDADLKRDPFTIKLRELWPMETPPAVATFIPNDDAIVTHLFQSAFPTTSVQQSHNVGIRLDLPQLNTQTYTFGFHLWYMNRRDARRLIRAIWSSEPFDLAAKTIIEPALFHFPKADSRRPAFVSIYVGNIERSIGLLADIESSIIVNNSIKPVSVDFLISHQDFDNQVLKIEIPTGRLLSDFIPFWDTMTATYSVSGTLADGRDFKALGTFMLIGYQRGDLNGDGMITVTDLTELVGLLFRTGQLPEPLELSDVNSDGSVNILDLTKLVDYLFRGFSL